ncbi:MAG: InlB B-repeat-containing protein [Thermoplasmata archaeon]
MVSPAHSVAPTHSTLSPTYYSPQLPVPGAATANGTFYQNYTMPSVSQGSHHLVCAPSPYTFFFCYPDDQDPTALLLQNGSVGLAFSRMTNQTQNTCANASINTTIRVGFSLSTNGGHTFGAPKLLGNDTCAYLQAFEPSFGVSSSGAIMGTFVEANVTAAQLFPYYYAPAITSYTTRSNDALGFVTSMDNGSTFSNVSTIDIAGHANIARPSLAVFGDTVYVAYENISNGTTSLNSTSSPPASVNLVYSSDGGVTWNGPYVLPGLNTYEYNTSFSPAIAVTSTGQVDVAYATNRHCIGYCSWASYAQEYGDSIVLSSSLSNGTSWSTPTIISKDLGTGESPEPAGGYNGLHKGGPGIFEMAPQISIAAPGSGGTIYVAWAGAANRSTGDYYYDFESFQAYSGVSVNGGISFSNATVGPGTVATLPPYYESAFDPAIGVSPSGTVYYTYTYYNESYGGSSCAAGSSTILVNGYYQAITTSTDGLHWASATVTYVSANAFADYLFYGHLASVAFNATGGPVVAYTTIPYYSYSYPYEIWTTRVQIASVWQGLTVNLTIDENNLTAGSSWGINVDGQTFSTTGSTITITNVPRGVPVLIGTSTGAIPVGYRTLTIGALSSPSETTLNGPTTIYLNYSLYYGITFVPDPKDLSLVEVEIFNYTAQPYQDLYYYWESGATYYYEGGSCLFPWYFKAGTHLDMGNAYSYPVGQYIYSPIPVSSWNGTGNGSFTGPGSTGNLVVNSPFNETFWVQSSGVYNVSVQALGIPSTSTFHFTWDGVAYSGTGSTPQLVSGVTTGMHHVTGVWATSSTSGWEYIGTLRNDGAIPIPDEPTVNLTFAYVDLGAASGVVSFHASGLTTGTVWHFSLNGTEYSSSTPWINVTTRSGNFSEAGYPVTSANGSVTYDPLTLAPRISVSTGSTYTVAFTRAYQLTIGVSSGGRVSPSAGSSWQAPGTVKTISSAPNAGYVFLGWAGTGLGSYTGTFANATVTMNGPIVETANFAPLVANRFNLTFTDAATLPNGTWWSVFVNGKGYSSNTSTITVPNVYSCVVSGSLGRYTIDVPYAYVNSSELTRYVPASYSGQACGNTVVSFSFNVQYYLALASTAGGSATATAGLQLSSVGMWVGPSDLVSLQATPANNYYFLGWNGTGAGNYTGTINPQSISVSGPVTELASFALIVIPPPQRYTVDFHLSSTFDAGTVWTVTINGTTYASSTADLNVSGLLAQVFPIGVSSAKSPDGLTLYTPVGAPGNVHVTGNQTVPLTFKTSYWVSVDVIGPGEASIQVGSSNTSSGWYASGTTVTVNAYATGTWIFSTWSGTGTGAYQGSQQSYTVQVKGPLHEVATFIPPVPATKVITSMWTSPTIWAGLAIAGALVGLLVGIAVARMRRGGSSGGA